MAAINNPEFWEEQWHEINRAVKAFSGYNSASVWNAMAADYGKHHTSENIDDRINATLDRLEESGVVFENAAILDVGCGPGRFAGAFVRRGATVVAIDISSNMIDRMFNDTGPEVLAHITPLVTDWKTLDLEANGYHKSFDLVFANMTPAVTDPTSFKKLMEASKKWCWFRGWAGRRDNPMLERLCKEVSGEATRPFSGNFICAWNLLCASGYFPECGFETIQWTHRKPLDECVKFHTIFFSHGDATKERELTGKIEAVLSEMAVDGYIENSVTGHTGNMVWSVD